MMATVEKHPDVEDVFVKKIKRVRELEEFIKHLDENYKHCLTRKTQQWLYKLINR